MTNKYPPGEQELLESFCGYSWSQGRTYYKGAYVDRPRFDPRNNDTDCMALVAEIEKNWRWSIDGGSIYGKKYDRRKCVSFSRVVPKSYIEPVETRTTFNEVWRHGVCDLAVPIAREWKANQQRHDPQCKVMRYPDLRVTEAVEKENCDCGVMTDER